jgi:hypothetical protein
MLGGDELAGLARAFLQAGARSLLVSLWPFTGRSGAQRVKHLPGDVWIQKTAVRSTKGSFAATARLGAAGAAGRRSPATSTMMLAPRPSTEPVRLGANWRAQLLPVLPHLRCLFVSSPLAFSGGRPGA